MTRLSVLTHQLLPGGKVQLSLSGPDGRSMTARLDTAYVKAKCWGLLADLDPDGVIEAALGDRTIASTAPIERTKPLGIRILGALRDGPKSCQGLAEVLGEKNKSITHRAQEMVRLGRARRCDATAGMGRGYPATYALTDLGRTYLATRGLAA
jgi:hypothetical protein